MEASEDKRARLRAIRPQFLVLDLEAACAFYRDKLGFAIAFTYGDFYAETERDGVALHLKLSDVPDPSRAFKRQEEHLDVYIVAEQIEALYAEYQERGVSFSKPLHDTPWGTREFVVTDDNGYILYFGQPI